MKNLHPALLSIISGLLLALAWPPLPTTFLIFGAFIPLFFLLEKEPGRLRFLAYVYLSMVTWNAITTWWMWNSTGPGAVAAILVNSLLMCLPWVALYNVRKRLGSNYGYWAFIACWMTFEYIHLNWELSWPWLTLGNVFAAQPEWVHWYQFTGTSGGSFWVLFINVVLFRQILAVGTHRKLLIRSFVWFMAAAIGIPLAISFMVRAFNMRLDTALNGSAAENIVIVQPNIDPYQKFETGTQQAQLAKLIHLSEQGIDSNTTLVVWPETAINLPNGIEEDSIRKNYFINPVWAFLKSHPHIKLFSGIEGYRMYKAIDKTVYSRQIPNTDIWYDAFNTAALLDSTGILTRYHKSKLVPGVESLPSFLRFLGPWFEQFGGTTGGYARQDERTVLKDPANGYAIAPAVCYESIYGEFMTGFIRNGANIIGIITNDGWWGNTAGHKQHLAYAKLRAIESRRWVVRSANTGISAVIDPYGRIVESQPWDKTGIIKQAIPARSQLTFYVRYGDLLSKLMILLAALLVAYSSYIFISNKYKTT
ncbi:apolipoprotein N-acyltransferase [Flavihumibacter fluvii]|uniref:apolipoprotein N-acyltransferase n=1 Tax=Flavihumibacter fluvii TaxID=2838157 RepID=UPI001BDE6744|nr:apolipoprotein N-acyltransferase [Flavihumibacter fluvii]ULQ53022.1 apolipoprotein N-acyltransferase [Flavihumibacter fluvii]